VVWLKGDGKMKKKIIKWFCDTYTYCVLQFKLADDILLPNRWLVEDQKVFLGVWGKEEKK